MTRLLALAAVAIAAVAIAAAAVALTAIGATVDPVPRPTPQIEPPPATPAAPGGDDERSAAGRAATRAAVSYALAARNWSARTVRAAWRRQYVLAAGRLRRELARTRPTSSQLAALNAERGSQLALVIGAPRPRPRVAIRRADVVVELAERTATAGRVVTYRSRNRARLRRTRAGWRVTGWTTLPDQEQRRELSR